MTPDMTMTTEQIQALLERLEEAEETLRAIRQGDVDGLVVAGPHGDQVFTLKGSDHPYRVMIEAMEEGAATLGVDGTILFCNRRFAEMLRLPHAQVLGAPMSRFLTPEYQVRFADLVMACRLDGLHNEMVLQAGDGTRVPVSLACSALPEGETESLCIVATDLTARYAAEAEIRQLNRELEARVESRTAELARANAALRAEITERKQAEAERERLLEDNRRQQQLLEELMVAAPIGIAVVSGPEHRYTYVNPAYQAIPGMVSPPMIGRSLAEVFPDLIAKGVIASVDQIYVTGLPVAFRAFEANVGRGREQTYWDVDEVPLFDAHGQVESILFLTREVTEQVLTAGALRESHDRFMALIHNVDSGVALVDEHGKFTVVNPMFMRMFGLADDPASILNVNDQDWSAWQVFEEDGTLLHVDNHPIRQAAMTGQAVRNKPVGMRLPSGDDLIWMLVSAEPILKPDGSIDQLICTYHDITERKQAEQTLRESEARYRNLYNVMPSGVAVYDVIDDGNDFVFKDMNPAGERIDNVQRAEVIGKSLYELFPNVREMGFDEVFRRVWQTGVSEFFPVTLYTDNNLSLWVTNYVWRLPSGELVALFDDITERKQAEEALRESEKRAHQHAAEMEAVFTAQADSVIVYDGDMVAIRANAAAQSLLGFDPTGRILSQNMDASHTPGGLSNSATARALQGEIVTGVEFQFLDQTGLSRSILASSAPIRDTDGHINGAVTVSHDITNIKRAEEALRESEERLTYHVNNSPLAVIEWGPDMRLTRWSDTAERLFGWKAEEVLGKRMEDFHWIYQEDQAQVAEVSEELQTGANPRRFSANRNYRKDGSVVHCEWYNSSLVDESGQLRSILSLVLDITERKQAEEAQARLASFPQLNPNPIVEVDLTGQIHFCNPAAERLFPHLMEQGLDHPWLVDWESIVRTSHAAERRKAIREVTIGDACFQQTMHYVPEIQRIRIYGLDITERKWAEESLRASEEWLHVTLRSIGDAVVACDHAGCVTFLNPVAASLTGWTQVEAIGQPITQVFNIINEMTLAPAENLVARVLRENCIVELANHTALVTRDGRFVPVEDSAAPITDSAGQVTGVVIVFHDVTERREADRAKDEFLAVLSHELQTPLTNMLGWSSMALEEPSAAFFAQAMEVVHRNAVRQKYLVDEMLDMSRLIHRKVELTLEQTDGGTQVQQAVENVRPSAAQRQITLVVDPQTEPLPILADPVRLQQCLGNLLHNSLKFTPAGGTITVSCRRDGDQAVFSVHDTGRGIIPAALPTLFALFRQVDRDERAGGLGLGLAVVRGIAELHGGRVWAESPGIGQGSTFYLALPLAACEEELDEFTFNAK